MTNGTGMEFPRTMTKGIFAGRTFDTINDYQKAVREVRRDQGGPPKRGKRGAVIAGDEHRFTLQVIAGSFEAKVTGDPRDGADVDRALGLLKAYTPRKAATP